MFIDSCIIFLMEVNAMKKNTYIKRILTCSFLMLMVSACGSTSSIKPVTNAQAGMSPVRSQGTNADKVAPAPDLSTYDTAVVLDFQDAGNKTAANGAIYADKIAHAIERKKIFKKVSRTPVPDKAVVISGVITGANEGNKALQLLVGFGAGTANFDAKVSLTDSSSNTPLGEILVDKNSWAMGGLVSTTQDVNYLMDVSSESIAEEVSKAKAMKIVAK